MLIGYFASIVFKYLDIRYVIVPIKSGKSKSFNNKISKTSPQKYISYLYHFVTLLDINLF